MASVLGLVPAGWLCACSAVQLVGLGGRTQWGDRQASTAQDAVHPCLRWEDVMTQPHAAGTWAFKKPRKQPQSKRWLHWRKAHPGLTLKKPNCLLQREKATSCHRPCSGKNVSGLVVAVRAKLAQARAGGDTEVAQTRRAAGAVEGSVFSSRLWGAGRAEWAEWSLMEKPNCER